MKGYDKSPCLCNSGLDFGNCCGLNPGTDYLEMFEFVRKFDTRVSLYRAFNEQIYADRFYEGQVRVSTLEHCRNLENKHARDTNEGIAVVGVQGEEPKDKEDMLPLNTSNTPLSQLEVPLVHLGNNTLKLENAYVLCLSTKYNKYMEQVYGKYCIKLKSPAAFFYVLNAVMRNLELVADIQPGPIIYDNSVFLNLNIMSTLIGLGFYKEEKFAKENEYRVRLLPILPDIEPVLIEIANMPNLCQKMY